MTPEPRSPGDAGNPPEASAPAPRSEAAGAGDPVEHHLTHARTLIESALTACRTRTSAAPITELPAADGQVDAVLRRLVSRARSSLICVAPDPERSDLARAAALEPPVRTAGPGVEVRLLCSPRAGTVHPRLRTERRDRNLRVRLCGHIAQEFLIVDERVALIGADRATATHPALLLEAPALVSPLHALFTAVWTAAHPLADEPATDDRRPDSVSAAILDSLRKGHTDEVAARRLGMSVRTYRRHVAELMRDLGAGSRFQAGVRAAERGLLTAARTA